MLVVSFPGGHVDQSDANIVETALREVQILNEIIDFGKIFLDF